MPGVCPRLYCNCDSWLFALTHQGTGGNARLHPPAASWNVHILRLLTCLTLSPKTDFTPTHGGQASTLPALQALPRAAPTLIFSSASCSGPNLPPRHLLPYPLLNLFLILGATPSNSTGRER